MKRGRLRSGVAGAALLTLAACMSTPPEEDPVQIKLNDLDTRLARIERVVSNQSLLDLANGMESLRSDVRSLHNDVDELSHSLETSRKQQRDLYTDLDRRLSALEARAGGATAGGGVAGAGGASGAPAAAGEGGAGSTVSASGATGSADGSPPLGSDTANYQAALALLKDSQYDRAIAAFQQFLQAFPESTYADNAQYWLGEAYYVNRSFQDALGAFQRVIDTYPQSRKVPDALLKIGFCDYELRQFQAARDVLGKVVATYPDTPAGSLAKQRLDKMTAEKH